MCGSYCCFSSTGTVMYARFIQAINSLSFLKIKTIASRRFLLSERTVTNMVGHSVITARVRLVPLGRSHVTA